MAITRDELESFHQFATGHLNKSAEDLTLEECLRLWRVRREEAETVEAVIAGVADIAAGRYHTADEVDAEIRRRFERLGRTEF